MTLYITNKAVATQIINGATWAAMEDALDGARSTTFSPCQISRLRDDERLAELQAEGLVMVWHGVAVVDVSVSAAVQAHSREPVGHDECRSAQSRPWQIRTVDRAFRS
jgi:hypothetical protein